MYFWCCRELAYIRIPQHQEVIKNEKAIPLVLGRQVDNILIEVIHLILHEKVPKQMWRNILDYDPLIELPDLFDEVAGVGEGELELQDRGIPPAAVFLG